MKIAARVAAVAVLAAFAAGCSTPPGPAPATPAPPLPADAIAYDDLLSTSRPFPYDGQCDQIKPEPLTQLKGKRTHVIKTLAGPGGCVIEVGSRTMEEIWIEPMSPPNKSEPRYFPLAWSGKATPSGTYFRRFVLDQRYYAVETVQFGGGQPGCYVAVDTGSPNAVQLRGILPEAYAATYPELDPGQTNYQIDHAGTAKFVDENCPAVEQAATVLLGSIDPGGGSLATR